MCLIKKKHQSSFNGQKVKYLLALKGAYNNE